MSKAAERVDASCISTAFSKQSVLATLSVYRAYAAAATFRVALLPLPSSAHQAVHVCGEWLNLPH